MLFGLQAQSKLKMVFFDHFQITAVGTKKKHHCK
jgi:hypothetical protein